MFFAPFTMLFWASFDLLNINNLRKWPKNSTLWRQEPQLAPIKSPSKKPGIKPIPEGGVFQLQGSVDFSQEVFHGDPRNHGFSY